MSFREESSDLPIQFNIASTDLRTDLNIFEINWRDLKVKGQTKLPDSSDGFIQILNESDDE